MAPIRLFTVFMDEPHAVIVLEGNIDFCTETAPPDSCDETKFWRIINLNKKTEPLQAPH